MKILDKIKNKIKNKETELKVDINEDIYLYKDKAKKYYEVIYLKNENIIIEPLKSFLAIQFKLDKEIQDTITEIQKELRISKFDDAFKVFCDLYQKQLIEENKLVEKIVYELDLKLKEKKFIRKDNKLIIKNNNLDMQLNFELLDENYMKENKEEYETYIKYIKTYFKEIDDILTSIAYFPFTRNRKTSFWYIVSPSNYGKTRILLEPLKNIGINSIIDEDKLDLQISPLTKDVFINKIVFSIDEFKKFKSTFKKFEDRLDVNPKNAGLLEIELFTKIFTSKELSQSLAEVADTQIRNRILFIYKTKETIADLFNKLGIQYTKDDLDFPLRTYCNHFNLDITKLKDYLQYYFYNFINDKIQELKNKDKFEVKEIVENFINSLEEKYRFNEKVEDTEDRIKRILYEFLEEKGILETDNQLIEFNLDNNKFSFVYKKDKNIVYVNSLASLLEHLISKEPKFIQKDLEYTLTSYKSFISNNKDRTTIYIDSKRKNMYPIDLKLITGIKQNNENNTDIIINKAKLDELKKELETAKKERKDLRKSLEIIISKYFGYSNLEALTNKELINFLDDLLSTNTADTTSIINNQDEKSNNEENINIEIGDFSADEIFDNEEEDEFPF